MSPLARSRQRSSGLVLTVNPIACTAHGMCAELLPEAITLDDWGYPIIDGRELPQELVELARQAADVCPTMALALRRAAGSRTR